MAGRRGGKQKRTAWPKTGIRRWISEKNRIMIIIHIIYMYKYYNFLSENSFVNRQNLRAAELFDCFWFAILKSLVYFHVIFVKVFESYNDIRFAIHLQVNTEICWNNYSSFFRVHEWWHFKKCEIHCTMYMHVMCTFILFFQPGQSKITELR